MTIRLEQTKSNDARLLDRMKIHYSQPKGIVGRRLCYAVYFGDTYYGHIIAGSATLHLPGREDFFGVYSLNQIINNIFFNVSGEYPCRNFTSKVVKEFIKVSAVNWQEKYGDEVIGFETLVELPRTGELYKRAGWSVIGQTKGYTCKRVAGEATEKWIKDKGGKGIRVWDTENLKPKLVLAYKCLVS